jgi:TetR/AcrR family transcriptional repressor of nem operon
MKKKRTKMRSLEESRKAILQVAFFEVLSKGFQGVSIDDIVEKTPYSKGAFYHHFPTKLDLGYALVEDVIGPMIIGRWIEPIKIYDNPIEGILAQLQKLIGDVDLKLLRLGCPLNNLVQEMSPVDHGFKLRLEKALKFWVDEMDLQLQRGKKNGFLKKDVRTKDAAYFVVMAHEGFYGTIKGITDKVVYRALLASLKVYLRSIGA